MEPDIHEKLLRYSNELEMNAEVALTKMCEEFSVTELEKIEELLLKIEKNPEMHNKEEYSVLLIVAVKSALFSKTMHDLKEALSQSDIYEKRRLLLEETLKGMKTAIPIDSYPTFKKDITIMGLLTLINFGSFLLLMNLIS